MSTFIEPEDITLGWKEFHEKYPEVEKWEYDQKVKEYQEM